MLKIKFLIVAVIFLSLSGCKLATPAIESSSDLTACGNFPMDQSADGGPTSRYLVCQSVDDGKCYYAKYSFEQIPGCDPQFDKYFYGKDECFRYLPSFFTFEGTPSQSIGGSNDNCAATTQSYFDSKVKL